MARVHGLEGEAGGRAVEVGVVDQLPHGIQNLLQKAPLNQPQLQHLLLAYDFLSIIKSKFSCEEEHCARRGEERREEMKGRDFFL